MLIGIPKERFTGEKRVATTPDAAQQLQKLGYDVAIESGAGESAKFRDSDYENAGVSIIKELEALYKTADIILKVREPVAEEIALLREGQLFVSFLAPAQSPELLQTLADKKVSALAMESIPRISRSQKMDALSSMANIAGYRAIVEAAQHFGRFFTGQITAAGKVPPAKVLVIGAGVAGLAAIGTAQSMGAIVRAFDTRPEVKEQVESMNGEFLMLEFEEDGSGEGGYAKTMSKEFIDAEMALFAEQAKEVDIIVTTALIPGRPAPELITEDMVKSMREGSVIVDLAAAMGGNCKLSEADKVVVKHGVSIIGYTDLPSRLPTQASQLYATNLRHLLTDMTPNKDGVFVVDFEDEAIRGATVTKDGEITFPPPAPKLSAAPKAKPQAVVEAAVEEKAPSKFRPWIPFIAGAVLLTWLGTVAPASFTAHFTVFVLACFVGYMVIWNVSPSLHTPLMSVTNAISSIIIIGALLQISSPSPWVMWLSAVTVLIASINIVGGFAVTQRMLDMFRK
ncbi:NAD(P) transhydrogenase alpha subunit [gamma proteobacterium IMCC1989]|nr:NAD(P) transhydrogenase alpha subunit [gamma proteobacterium IMCC1989]